MRHEEVGKKSPITCFILAFKRGYIDLKNTIAKHSRCVRTLLRLGLYMYPSLLNIDEERCRVLYEECRKRVAQTPQRQAFVSPISNKKRRNSANNGYLTHPLPHSILWVSAPPVWALAAEKARYANPSFSPCIALGLTSLARLL